MAGKVAQFRDMQDSMAANIAGMWTSFDSQRSNWKAEKKELRNYLFATDTTTTSNKTLPWKNSTTLPKLTQIRDNLHSNYLSAMFPNDDWLRWEAYSMDGAEKSKANAIEAYMKNKTREDELRVTCSQLLLDYIDYGNAFATTEYIHKVKENEDGPSVIYSGPRLIRIHPNDIVFNPLAARFEDSPVIIRSIMQLGEFLVWVEDNPDSVDRSKIQPILDMRNGIGGTLKEDSDKTEGLSVDGFGTYTEYLQSGSVEVLTFYGDMYDIETKQLKRNHKIMVVDRMFVLMDETMPSWLGRNIFHAGWRNRPENLWAMGPLDNLVGMQYRIDHLENLKADVFDLIAHPIVKVIGDVEDFVWRPGAQVHIDDPQMGDVQILSPDSNALNADFQIQQLEARMEEYAGAPKQAMGMRTPGEKTAFEVSQLQNAASRIFQEKITSFEVNLLEPALNAMLETARRNIDTSDVVRVMDTDLGVMEFLKITQDDITARGKLRPLGAHHYATQAKLMQELTQIFNSAIGQMMQPHTSTKRLTELVSDVMNLDRFDLFKPNIGLMEQAETQQLAMTLQQEVQAQAMTPTEPQTNVQQ